MATHPGRTLSQAEARWRIRVDGVVQGVGFRPFVYGLAGRLGLAGWVLNDSGGVLIEAQGAPATLEKFLRGIGDLAPPLAVVESVRAEAVAAKPDDGFRIVASAPGGARVVLVSPDVAACADCLGEMADPTDRRFAYPFTNCTNCGPRFTITTDVPYDRPNTTMAGFGLCAACAAEYGDPLDRRFHAQPVCCPACGPALRLVGAAEGSPVPGEPLIEAAALLGRGGVLAVKGIGGYHLAALASSEATVARLRAAKHREDKPFAVLAPDLAGARMLCHLDEAEVELLRSPRAPVVLAPRREGARVAPSVAPGNRHLGVMLPYSPLHHRLVGEVGAAVVLTSGNVSDEPIAYRDDDALVRLAPLVDAFLLHDRPIHTRVDDSVTRVFRGTEMVLRRARGYAPRPLALPWSFRRPVLATGAELKSTFCLGRGRHAFVSHHLGDLENAETWAAWREGVDHYRRLFDVEPEVVAHDLHPEYLATKWALEDSGLEVVGVQHHHAHIASCLAEHGHDSAVLGVAFDGLGWGSDATLWGGEILVADLGGYERVAHLEAVPLPGGAAAIREPWRMAAAWLDAAFEGAAPEGLDVSQRNAPRWDAVLHMARTGLSAPATTSAGRLFDAVAALCGIRDRVNYEGQAAIELEQRADPAAAGAYPLPLLDGPVLRLGATALVRAVVADLVAGVPVPVVAMRFHRGLAAGVVAVCRRLRHDRGLGTVALSGGVFQNLVLLGETSDGLEAAGFTVLRHSRVPPNDGGISLGQAAVAGALDRR